LQPQPKSPHTPRNIFAVLRNPTPSEVTKGTNDSPNPPSSSAVAAPLDMPPLPAFTSPLQMQLWMGVVQKSIVKVVDPSNKKKKKDANGNTKSTVREELSEDHFLPEHDHRQQPLSSSALLQQEHQPSSSFYRHTRDTGVYVDYSTFDDGESISSIDLLFKWLMCRDLTLPAEGRGGHRNQTGGTINTDDNVQVESDVSFDPEAQPRRRVLFSP
jgi:hypothetical protein